MKTIFLVILLAIEISGTALAGAVVKDPIHDFLFNNSDPDNIFAISQLKCIYKLKLDIENNGKPVVFLGMNGFGAQGANIWEAYAPSDGGYRKVEITDDNFFFRRDMFYVGYISIVKRYGLLVFLPGNGGGDLNFLQIINGRVKVQKVANISTSSPKDQKEIETYFGKPADRKSLHDHPVKTLALDDLRNTGYNVDVAISIAKAKIK